jgi:hypothetical protein
VLLVSVALEQVSTRGSEVTKGTRNTCQLDVDASKLRRKNTCLLSSRAANVFQVTFRFRTEVVVSDEDVIVLLVDVGLQLGLLQRPVVAQLAAELRLAHPNGQVFEPWLRGCSEMKNKAF